MNGRVDIIGDGNNTYSCNALNNCPGKTRFRFSDKMPVDSKYTNYRGALTGVWENNNLSNAFFSKENIRILQNGIRAGVYNKSGNKKFLIGQQNMDSLKIIMRSIFLQHSMNRPTEIPEQIQQLNKMIYDYAIPQILGEANGYIKYKRDVSTLPVPLDLPRNMSHIGLNDMELKPWFNSNQ